MKGISLSPGDYTHFKSQVPLHKITIGAKQWRYYDFGPKMVPPLICIPGIAGNADVYYKQIMALSMKGYRVISIDIPCVWNYHEWVHAFEKFLDTINIHYVHLYGTSLGGFLAQLFAQHRPRRVKSLVLSNTFLETQKFSAAMPWAPVYRFILTGIRDGPHEPFIADSIDFVVGQVERLSVEDLSSRLTLNANAVAVGPLLLSDSFITLMDDIHPPSQCTASYNSLFGQPVCTYGVFPVTMIRLKSSYKRIFSESLLEFLNFIWTPPVPSVNIYCSAAVSEYRQTNDYCSIPQQLKDQVTERYSGARRAILKTGGDFPFLSRSDEVNLHLQLHLRHVGVEPKPDLVQDISGNGNAGSSANDKNAGGGFDDDPPEDRGDSGHVSETDQSGPSEAGSNKLDEQFLSNVRLCLLALETAPLMVHGSTLLVLHLCVATLCTCWKPLMMA